MGRDGGVLTTTRQEAKSSYLRFSAAERPAPQSLHHRKNPRPSKPLRRALGCQAEGVVAAHLTRPSVPPPDLRTPCNEGFA